MIQLQDAITTVTSGVIDLRHVGAGNIAVLDTEAGDVWIRWGDVRLVMTPKQAQVLSQHFFRSIGQGIQEATGGQVAVKAPSAAFGGPVKPLQGMDKFDPALALAVASNGIANLTFEQATNLRDTLNTALGRYSDEPQTDAPRRRSPQPA